MKKLDGKTALITGGTTGIGLAAAKLFNEEGARVFVTGRNPDTIAVAIKELGSRATVLRADTADSEAMKRLFAEVGALDVIFANAGLLGGGLIEDQPEDEFDAIMNVNFKGQWLAIRHGGAKVRDGGSIVLCGSITGYMGMAGTTAYAASKAAVRALGRVAAAELAPRGIRVNVLSPGPTKSGILQKQRGKEGGDAVEAVLAANIPLNRMAEPVEIARAALFLASSDSSFMTGAEIIVDGGLTQLQKRL